MGLKNYQFNKILREYDRKQLQNKRELDKRVQEIYKKIPALKDLNEKIISNSIKNAKLLLLEEKDTLEQLKETNLDYSMSKIELLNEYGYPSNYLQLQYYCSDCKDTGYINNKKCHCFKQAIVDLVYSQSNIKSAIQKENFQHFSFQYYRDDFIDPITNLSPLQNAKKVIHTCKEFIRDFDTNYNNLLIYGNTGVGKTFLINCIAKELLDTAHTVIYLTAFQLFDILEKNKFFKNKETYEIETQFDYILNCDLLAIDDLGTELTNSFISSQLYLCINERHLRKKATIISTNLSLDNFHDNYSERIFSRLSSHYISLKIVGEDIRLKKVMN